MTLEPQGDPTQPIQQALPAVFRFLDLSGVFFNGILGGRLAREKRFDFVGFVVLGMLSGMGGGIVRDVMLNAGPPIALTDRYYLIMALLGALIAWLWRFDGKWSRRTLVTFDALVLGCWAATGTSKALGLGFAVIPSILMGVTTAIGGGMIRDISAGNVPAVFGGNSLYATPALCAACLDAGLFQAGHAGLYRIGFDLHHPGFLEALGAARGAQLDGFDDAPPVATAPTQETPGARLAPSVGNARHRGRGRRECICLWITFFPV